MAIDIEAPGANEAELQRALSDLLEMRGCRVRMTADDAAQNITTEAAISFDEATKDTDSFYSAGTPTRIATIPAGLGITDVDVWGQVAVSSTTADTTSIVSIQHKNSAGTVQGVYGNRFIEKGLTTWTMQAHAFNVPVSDGDYFELTAREETDNSVTIIGTGTSRTMAGLRVVGMNPV